MKTVHVNQCTQEELEWLPGVGPATAKKIVEARPIGAETELEQIVPPAAWLKIEKADVAFDFSTDGAEISAEDLRRKELLTILADKERQLSKAEAVELRELLQKVPWPTGLDLSYQPAEPHLILAEPEPMTLRRVLPGQELKAGASYLCIWNMRWAQDGQAVTPADLPTELEIEGWFNDHDMSIAFAHYGPSVRIYTRNRGLVPLVLFEIIKETEEAENAEEDPEGDSQGDGEGN